MLSFGGTDLASFCVSLAVKSFAAFWTSSCSVQEKSEHSTSTNPVPLLQTTSTARQTNRQANKASDKQILWQAIVHTECLKHSFEPFRIRRRVLGIVLDVSAVHERDARLDVVERGRDTTEDFLRRRNLLEVHVEGGGRHVFVELSKLCEGGCDVCNECGDYSAEQGGNKTSGENSLPSASRTRRKRGARGAAAMPLLTTVKR